MLKSELKIIKCVSQITYLTEKRKKTRHKGIKRERKKERSKQ
jgi:hypothetical protein